MGVAGVAVMAAFLLRTGRDTFTCVLFSSGSSLHMYVLLVLTGLVYNIDEAYLGAVNQLAWVLLLLASIVLRHHARLLRAGRQATPAALPAPHPVLFAG